ncbi:hypothetical protein [Rhodospirillum centenum]|uniref:Uncharacterized protein n=1 Tax=Rhodospirillum centenum (strain ATCC 51521 / SW) TaxID=414684 RepID=B6IV04_RHOCS|nr:hypothetical protein [Rhodospirillum centenum]ACJ00086.1 hypothetical protein RC1_2711 [Rhodospirillum centenum SW]
MPTEIRHIIFTGDEVIRALVEYHKRSGNPLPPGAVIRCQYESLPDLCCLLHLALDADGSRQVFRVERAPLAAALIFFCIHNRIPLPTRATKQIQLLNEQLALVITRTPANDRPQR